MLLVNGFNADSELTITPQVWSTAYGIYAAGALLSFFMSYRGLPETRGLALAQASTETHEQTNRINPQLYVLMSIVLFTNFSDGLKYYVLRYIQDHLTTNLVWIALSYIPAAIIWGTLPARMGLFADKYGRKPPISFGLTVSGLLARRFVFPV